MINICLKYFLVSRIIFIFFIILPLNQYLVRKYDASNDLLLTQTQLGKLNINEINYFSDQETLKIFEFNNLNFVENILLRYLKHFNAYDTIHFMHIAKNGYSNEKNFVFFPVFPKLIEYSQKILMLNYLLNFKYEITSYLLLGFIISNIICLLNCFLLAR